MIINRMLADGALVRRGDRYAIDHDRALTTFEPFLAEILALQTHGTRHEASGYVDRWAAWGEENARIGALEKAVAKVRYAYEAGPLEPAPPGLEGDLGLGSG